MKTEKIKQGCAGLSVLFLLLVILIIVIAPEPEKPIAEAPGIDRKAAEAAKPALSAKAEELLTIIRQASMASVTCKFNFEETVSLISDAPKKPENLMKAYSEAHRGEPNCQEASDNLRQIERLTLSTEALTNNLDLALDDCTKAAELRRDGLKTVKVALDGDNSFATAQKFLDGAIDARSRQAQCIDGLKSIGRESGIPADAMSFLDA
jgi:hypothetical protein